MKKKNLIEIMNKLPHNTKLWCDMIGEVYFLGIDDTVMPGKKSETNYIIAIKGVDNGYYECLTEYGTFYDDSDLCPCVLWPSKEHRTWDGWEKVLKVANYKVGDWVVYCDWVVKITDIKGDKVYVVDQNGYNDGFILIDFIENKWHIEDCKCGDVLINTHNGDIVVFDKRTSASYFNTLVMTTKDGKYGVSAIYDCYYFRPAEHKDIVEFKERLAKFDMFWDEDANKITKYGIGTTLKLKGKDYYANVLEVCDNHIEVCGEGFLFGSINKRELDKWENVK